MNPNPLGRLLIVAWLLLRLPLPAAEPGPPLTASVSAGTNSVSPKLPRLLPPVVPLSLTNVLVAEENKDWLAGGVWTQPPRGRTNDFAGVRFWIEGLVQLKGQGVTDGGRKFRAKVVLPVPATKTNWQTLHLLGGTSYDADIGTKVAEFIWRYADGTFRRSPIQYGIHLRDWWGVRYEDPPVVSDKHSRAVWHGQHADARSRGKFLRLYLTSLANPDTNRVVKSLEFLSGNSRASLFLVGVTLDVLPRGERGADFADLDDGRPGFSAAQFVTVTDAATGKPIEGVEVEAQLREGVGTDNEAHFKHTVKTSATGLATLPKGGGPLDFLELHLRAENYGGIVKTLESKKDGPIPPNFEVKLKGGILIGGLVEDPDGQPLPGAKIALNQIYRNSEDFQKAERPDFGSKEFTTDQDGRWQTQSVPADVFPNLIVQAKHADYLSPYSAVVGDNVTLETQLKHLKYTVRLLRGVVVAGVVLGADEKPFSGAKVTVGRPYDQDSRRETTSGADGRFILHNVRPELQAVTASATGYSPASKTVTPGTNTVEVTLQLKVGKKISGVVLNPEGLPVEGVQVRYDPEDWEERQRTNLEWEAKTDADGHFEWTDGPDKPVEVSVWKEGYASKRALKLTPGDEENIIRLTRVRKVLGVVGNEETNEPVTKFNVQWAEGDENGFHRWSDTDRKEFDDPQGHFALDLGDEKQNVIKVEADDFEPRRAVLPAAQNDYVQISVLLKPSPSPGGLVINPAGEPVPEVSVVLTGKDQSVQLGKGRLTGFGGDSRLTKSDAQGRFKLRPTVSPGRVVAVSDAGYGETPWAQFLATHTVELQPWGRIEGTLYSAGKPVAGRDILLTLQSVGTFDGLHTDFNAYKATSDEQGRFVIEKVPAGSRSLTQLLKTSENSWQHVNPTDVEVLPGQTTVVQIGNVGATVRGRVNSAAVTAGKAEAKVMIALGTPFPPPPEGLKGPADYQAWQTSEAFRAAMKTFRNYAALAEPDGSFQLDGVQPGNYTLSAHADMPKPEGKSWEREMLGNASKPVVIGEAAAQSPIEFDAGELVLAPVAKPPADAPAP